MITDANSGERIQQLENELAAAKQRIAELERARSGAAEVVGEPPVPITEFEETLKRLVQRIAMILQAEKCVIMIRDRETGDLIARSPAFGLKEDEVAQFRVGVDTSISSEVFRSGEPLIFHDVAEVTGTEKALFQQLRIHNGLTVPLFIEKRDEQNRLVDRIMVGVLHCFNKRYGGEFIEEDVRLLVRLSGNTAAVIANAQLFQEVVEEKQKLVHTLESLTAGLILVNQHERIGQMNAQARAMFGLKQGENPTGRPLAEIVRDENCLKVIRRKIEEVQNPDLVNSEEDDSQNGRRQPDEITITDQDEEQYIYQVHAAVVRDDKEQPIGTVVIFNDITDIRNVERMKTEFVSIVSHELRTPLTPMKGFVRTLLDDENEEWYTREDRREFYQIIEENVDRLGRLINDLLNVSRIERMGAAGIEMNWEENVDLREAAEEVVSTQRGRSDKHTLVIDFEPEHIYAETDPDKIQNILQNFVSNAIKYSPDGGEVRIIGRLEPANDEFPQGSVVLGVKDQGLGIPEAALKKLGEKFFRVNHRHPTGSRVSGTGIGLFLVKNLIQRHHGTMWVESTVGKGSTFWFRIPVKQPQEAEEPNAV